MGRKTQDWPAETRPHYIKIFSLNERLRAHLKVALELAVTKRLISYKAQLNNEDGILRNAYPLLERIQDEARAIIDLHTIHAKGGRPPRWFEIATRIEGLAGGITKTLKAIEADLTHSLDTAVRIKTTNAVKAAQEIRDQQLSHFLDNAEIGLDDYGLETVVDQLENHILDMSTSQWKLITLTAKR